ncbi:hypothetical protein [Pseudactinotalea suaedae]|uniref:hypothetical protein n=1 Tax=Pseudactinotalea suaedae TaxID=1524924 RepID=UPI0012E2A091|nr:hypothetical protein [Pseudactinotalea suaedae]
MTNRPPEVDAWIDDLDATDRDLYHAIETTILATGLVEQIVFSYKLPTFKRGNRPVTVARWKGGISLSTRDPAPIEQFRAKHPDLTGGKISIQLRRDRPVPHEDLAELVTAALASEH